MMIYGLCYWRECFGLGGVLVGILAEKYGEVHDSGLIPCDLGYAGCKGMSFKRNGARHQAQGVRK